MEALLKHRTLLYIAIILFSCLIGYRDLTHTTMGGIYIASFVLFVVLMLPYDMGVKFSFFILPFTCGIPGYTITGIFLLLLAKSKHVCIEQILPPIIFGIAEFAHCAFYDFNVEYNIILSFISFVFLFFYLLFDRNEVNRIDCIKLFIYGSIATLLIIYIKILLQNSIEDLISGSLRSGLNMGLDADEEVEIGFLGMNANSIGLFSIAVYSLLLILGNKTLKMSGYSYAILVTLSLAAGFLSFSRTWILLACLITFIFLLTLKQRQSRLIIFILTAIIVIITQTSILDTGLDTFYERFNSDKMYGGRFEVFEFYNDFWLSDLKTFFLGAGTVYNMEVANGSLAIHNSFQQIYVGFGVVGFLFFLFMMAVYIKRYMTKSTPLIYIIPLLSCILFSQSIQFWYPSYLVFPYIVTAYALRLSQTNKLYK